MALPATPPNKSPLLDDLKQKNFEVPPDTLVVRGYLGPTDIFEQVNRLLETFNVKKTSGSSISRISDSNITRILDAKSAPWRIYLSARLDRYIEIDDWAECVVRVFAETDHDRLESHTVWLRRFYPRGHEMEYHPIPYRILTLDHLTSATGFIAGELVEHYLSRRESRNVVWDEQDYGVTTGKSSGRPCF